MESSLYPDLAVKSYLIFEMFTLFFKQIIYLQFLVEYWLWFCEIFPNTFLFIFAATLKITVLAVSSVISFPSEMSEIFHLQRQRRLPDTTNQGRIYL